MTMSPGLSPKRSCFLFWGGGRCRGGGGGAQGLRQVEYERSADKAVGFSVGPDVVGVPSVTAWGTEVRSEPGTAAEPIQRGLESESSP